MLISLADAPRTTAGGKAAALGALLREGLSVPDGFIVPSSENRPDTNLPPSLRQAIGRALQELGSPIVAVRSSAANEDSAGASAAGQYESVIGVRGIDEVCSAIATCRESARTTRIEEYWERNPAAVELTNSNMAVLVQRLIDADAAGVLFTPEQSGVPTRIEASWGLGLSVVGGTIVPDAYEIFHDGDVRCTLGSKQNRTDLNLEDGGTTISVVTAEQQVARVLDDDLARKLARIGDRIAAIFHGPQDIEWAIKDGQIWIVQARPITAPLPAKPAADTDSPVEILVGTPASHGIVSAPARIVRGPSDFPSVRPGEIIICPYTDPAWTPLFTIAAGVISETGGALSHAAIVAREYGIPAVLGITEATTRFVNGDRVTLDGTAGTITGY